MRILSQFLESRTGNFAVIMAICAPVLFGIGGLATMGLDTAFIGGAQGSLDGFQVALVPAGRERPRRGAMFRFS